MHSEKRARKNSEDIGHIFDEEPTPIDQQVQDLQNALENERDARLEERFLFIVFIVLLLDVVFFSVMDNSGGPIALLILELLILIPLARRMGMEEIAQILDRTLSRMAGNTKTPED